MMYKLLVGAAFITTAFGKGKGKVDCSTLAQDLCTGKCEWAADGEGVESCMKAAKGGKGKGGKGKKEKPVKVDCTTLTVEADCTGAKKCAWTADDLGSGTCAKGGKGKGKGEKKEKKDKLSKEEKKAQKELDKAEKKGKGKKGPKGDSDDTVEETDDTTEETDDTTEETDDTTEEEETNEDGRRRLMQRLNM